VRFDLVLLTNFKYPGFLEPVMLLAAAAMLAELAVLNVLKTVTNQKELRL